MYDNELMEKINRIIEAKKQSVLLDNEQSKELPSKIRPMFTSAN